MPEKPAYRYDPGEGRYKHRWNKGEAGFEPSGRGPVGKCPKSMNLELAQALLENGIEYWDGDEFPARIYNVYNGVVYEAVPTEPGKSYHGYPWRGDRGMGAGLPPRIRRELEAYARKEGKLKEFLRWMKRYGGRP